MISDFPPLMTGHELKPGQSPARKAASGAEKGKYEAGDLLWVRDLNVLNYALVLEPDVDREKALQMIHTQLVALGDAIGAIAPPEVAITHRWPNDVLANGAKIGEVTAILSEDDDTAGTPRFMVIATHINVRPTSDDLNPGLDQTKTTLWDEGCGDLDAMQLLASSARHLMAWIHTWQEEGMQPILTLLDGRMERGHALDIAGQTGTFMGMDENANLFLKTENGTRIIKTSDALDTTIKAHVP